MIKVKPIGKKDPLEFEVVVHEGESDTKLARIDSFGSWSRRN